MNKKVTIREAVNYVINSKGEKHTLLGIGPMSENFLRASLEISKEKDFQEFFPVWNKLTAGQQEQLEHAVRYEHAKKGTIIHNGSLEDRKSVV